MLVTVFCAPRDSPESTFALDVSPELELRDFVALCELESGIPAGEIQITYVEQHLKDPTRALGTYGVKDGDVVVLSQADRRPPPTQPAFPGLPHIDFRSITVPGTSSSSGGQRAAVRSQQQAPQPSPQQQQQPSPTQPQQQSSPQQSMPSALRGSNPQGLDDPALLQQMLLSNPHELSLLKERNPPLAEALLSGDLERFTKVLLEQQQDRARREQERIRLLTADPFDLAAQAKIEEDIRQHNVEENMTIAMEEAPESFGQVVMLYINCKVNGHPVKAFVDSGAQMTIMSQACAERCNIMRLVDRRWAGIAKGVGTQKIIGRVHLAQIHIEGIFLPCSFSILEDQPMDMLLGLDMLKRHQCSIDLKKNVLLIGTTATETRFLSEAELPECARLAYGAEGREDARPDEIADRELAEALQRSIQESDTADGQTTSPQPQPLPFTLPRTLDQISSSTTTTTTSQSSQCPPPSTLDRSQSAPGAIEQVSTSEQHQSGLSLASSSPLAEDRPVQNSSSKVSPVPVTSTEIIHAGSPLEDMATVPQYPGVEAHPRAEEGDTSSDEVVDSSMVCPHPMELSPTTQPMDQEDARACPSSPSQLDSVDMESPTASRDAASSERDQPEGEQHNSGLLSSVDNSNVQTVDNNNIPSLAAALKELHQLLVSNDHARSQSRSASSSPSPCSQSNQQQEMDPVVLDKGAPTPEKKKHPDLSTAISEGAKPKDAKADHNAAPASEEGQSECRVPDFPGKKEEHDTNNPSTVQPEPESEVPPDFREPPEGQQGRGVADGRASGTNTPDTLGSLQQTEHAFLSPLSMAVGSPEEVSSTISSSSSTVETPQLTSGPSPVLSSLQHPLTIEQFPAEHIQRIQAAGFSATEAAEALHQAHGVVELALLALLARSITVPT